MLDIDVLISAALSRGGAPAHLMESWLGGAFELVTSLPSVRSRDPGDDFLISLAAQSRSILVSGVPDLLELANRIPVSAPADFLGSLTAA